MADVPLFGLQHFETSSCQQFVTVLIIMDVVCVLSLKI